MISQLLIEQKGFRMIAVEADWPDCVTINHFIHGQDINDPLLGFTRFPEWMWKNQTMRTFTEWMKDWNIANAYALDFYGLDVYSLQKYIRVNYFIDQQKQLSAISTLSILLLPLKQKKCINALTSTITIPYCIHCR